MLSQGSGVHHTRSSLDSIITHQYQFRKRASILTVCAQFQSLSEKPVFIGQLHAIMIK